jgi:hypothetical protein
MATKTKMEAKTFFSNSRKDFFAVVFLLKIKLLYNNFFLKFQNGGYIKMAILYTNFLRDELKDDIFQKFYRFCYSIAEPLNESYNFLICCSSDAENNVAKPKNQNGG